MTKDDQRPHDEARKRAVQTHRSAHDRVTRTSPCGQHSRRGGRGTTEGEAPPSYRRPRDDVRHRSSPHNHVAKDAEWKSGATIERYTQIRRVLGGATKGSEAAHFDPEMLSELMASSSEEHYTYAEMNGMLLKAKPFGSDYKKRIRNDEGEGCDHASRTSKAPPSR